MLKLDFPRNGSPTTPFLRVSDCEIDQASKCCELVDAIWNKKSFKRMNSVVRLLNWHGDSVRFANARDIRGRTPLIHAVLASAVDIIPILVECPTVNVWCRDLFNNTALTYAVGNDNYDVMNVLLKAVKLRLKSDESFLTYLEAENYDQDTAMMLALKSGNEECLDTLSDVLKTTLDNQRMVNDNFIVKINPIPKLKKLLHLDIQPALRRTSPMTCRRACRMSSSPTFRRSYTD